MQVEKKSKSNEEKLLQLLSSPKFSSVENVRFLVAPDKIVSDEAIVEDVLYIFENIDELKKRKKAI